MSFGYSKGFGSEETKAAESVQAFSDAAEQAIVEHQVLLDLRVRRLSVAVAILCVIVIAVAMATITWALLDGTVAGQVAGLAVGVVLVAAIVAYALARSAE